MSSRLDGWVQVWPKKRLRSIRTGVKAPAVRMSGVESRSLRQVPAEKATSRTASFGRYSNTTPGLQACWAEPCPTTRLKLNPATTPSRSVRWPDHSAPPAGERVP
jgi:hypothetical protein